MMQIEHGDGKGGDPVLSPSGWKPYASRCSLRCGRCGVPDLEAVSKGPARQGTLKSVARQRCAKERIGLGPPRVQAFDEGAHIVVAPKTNSRVLLLEGEQAWIG